MVLMLKVHVSFCPVLTVVTLHDTMNMLNATEGRLWHFVGADLIKNETNTGYRTVTRNKGSNRGPRFRSRFRSEMMPLWYIKAT